MWPGIELKRTVAILGGNSDLFELLIIVRLLEIYFGQVECYSTASFPEVAL